MNKKVVLTVVTVLLLGLVLTVVFDRRKVAINPVMAERAPQTGKTLTDADVVGIWINHHDKDIHQKIKFTANHKWRENQHGVTDIYSGTWKRIDNDKISLAPYGEKIQLYGDHFQTMKVLSYNHILNKVTK